MDRYLPKLLHLSGSRVQLAHVHTVIRNSLSILEGIDNLAKLMTERASVTGFVSTLFSPPSRYLPQARISLTQSQTYLPKTRVPFLRAAGELVLQRSIVVREMSARQIKHVAQFW
jgi:hypothetical protein